jgi:tetratricopeptide (TPR) repeat protein
MTTDINLHEINLVSSGKLKLRATARLAEGSDEAVFEACVLFHEAARFERRALEALSQCPAITRLTASVEECWCLVRGRDPHAAGDVWSRVLSEAQAIDSSTAASIMSRLKPEYEAAIRDFVTLIQRSPTLQLSTRALLRGAPSLVPQNAADRTAALKELRSLLKVFPGVPSLWSLLAHIEDTNENHLEAWKALQRALALAPDNQQFRALSLITATEALPRSDADAYLRQARPTLDKASAEVCVMYAFAEIQLAQSKKAGRVERWQRALEAVDIAFPRTHSEGLRKNLTALRLLLRDLIDQRDADPNVLYRAGLGGLAATRSGPPMDVLREDAQAHVNAMRVSEAAA